MSSLGECAWINMAQECLDEYTCSFNAWYKSLKTGKESLVVPDTNWMTEKTQGVPSLAALHAMHQNFVLKMEIIMRKTGIFDKVEHAIKPSTGEENRSADPSLQIVVAQQVKVIEELHQLLERAEEIMGSLKKRVISCEEQLQKHSTTKRKKITGGEEVCSKSPQEGISLALEDNECIPSNVKQIVADLCFRYPGDANIALLLGALNDSYSSNRQAQKMLQVARQERLDAEVAWEVKLSGMMKRMEVLENLVKRSSLPEYRRNQKSEERTESEERNKTF